MPADDQETVFPCASVMVMMVLLKVAATWATPTTTFFFSFLRARGALPEPFLSSAILLGHFLLAGDRLGRPLAGTGIGVGALAANRQALTVAQAPIAAQIHQPLDVHRHFAAQVAFNLEVAVDNFADLDDLGLGQNADPALRRDAELVDDLARGMRPDSMDIAKADFDPFLRRDIDAGDACQDVSPVADKPLNLLYKNGALRRRPKLDPSEGGKRPEKPGNDRKTVARARIIGMHPLPSTAWRD